jgi:hypothetical protein
VPFLVDDERKIEPDGRVVDALDAEIQRSGSPAIRRKYSKAPSEAARVLSRNCLPSQRMFPPASRFVPRSPPHSGNA